MINNFKICLAKYKVLASLAVLIIVVFLRRVAYVEEIGTAMSGPMIVLSIFIFSDIYFLEYRQKTIDIISLMPICERRKMIFQRILSINVFIMAAAAFTFWPFIIIQSPESVNNDMNIFRVWVEAVVACYCCSVMFGTISFFLVNITNKLWIGIGFAILLMVVISSSFGQNNIPKSINVMSYTFRDLSETVDYSWLGGAFFGMMLSLILIFFNGKNLKRIRKDG